MHKLMDILHVDVEVSEDELCEGALKVVACIRNAWSKGNVKCKIYKDGHTNKLVACSKEGEVILVRVYGKNTNLLINRHQEKLTMTLLSTIGCARPIFCSFNNGIAYGFAPGTIINNHTLFDINVQRLVAREMVKMHSFDIEKALEEVGGRNLFDTKACLFSKMAEWLSHIQDHTTMPTGWTKEMIRREVDELEGHLVELNSPTVFCHNDLLPGNIIYDKDTNKVSFVDFEYSFPNYQAFDIGNFFCEFAGMNSIDYNLYPSEDFQKEWLSEYLRSLKGGEIDQKELQLLYVQVNKFALASHIFWAIWGIVQSHHSTIDYNYLEFAQIRLTEYQRRKQEFLQLKVPC